MSGIYAVARTRMLSGGFNWPALPVNLYLVGPGYTPDYAVHATLADIAPAQRSAGPLALSGLANLNGAADAADLALTNLTALLPVRGALLVDATGGVGESNALVAYLDQGQGFGAVFSAEPASISFNSLGVFQP